MIHEQKGPEYWQLRTLGIALSTVLMHWAHRCLTPIWCPYSVGCHGISAPGKTVFITSLIANLLSGAKLPQFAASAQDRIELAYLTHSQTTRLRGLTMKRIWRNCAHIPQLGPITPRGSAPCANPKTAPDRLAFGSAWAVEQHIDIVDYPGEWLLDLGLMDKSYEEWSTDVLHRMASRSLAQNM